MENIVYISKEIERKWQREWFRREAFRATEEKKPKYYVLDMFPYPSGKGLHVGHLKGYVASDVIARYKRACGFEVLHPMGWDSFGLPTERQAEKEGINPIEVTERNICAFRKQLDAVGLSFDWSREITTSEPSYYRWTQWIFTKLFENGLAYQEEVIVNWCPSVKTVLANEEVLDGKYIETGDPVERIKMKQWMLKITAYADRLLDDLDLVDWPESIKAMQRNWIGRSPGALIEFLVTDGKSKLEVFTTRPDTIFGATYLVVAPEHPLIDMVLEESDNPELAAYVGTARNLGDIERQERAGGNSSGHDTGLKVVNPVTGDELPVWTSEYVLGGYGTGAIMAVPAHDARDFAFATTFDLPIKYVVTESKYYLARWFCENIELEKISGASDSTGWQAVLARFILSAAQSTSCLRLLEFFEKALCKEQPPLTAEEVYNVLTSITKGINWHSFLSFKQSINSEKFNPVKSGAFIDFGYSIRSSSPQLTLDGLQTKEAIVKVIQWLQQTQSGRAHTSYKIRDWLFSRQRYWGEPIPIIYDKFGNPSVIQEHDLPVELPHLSMNKSNREDLGDNNAMPKPPLEQAQEEWRLLKIDGDTFVRETNTMPQWAGSCWYYLRFADPGNQLELCEAKQGEFWLPVDLYVGGAEHATLHLLYSRFWHKFLYDIGLVSSKEPFKRLFNQGMVHSASFRDEKGKYYYPHEIVINEDRFLTSDGIPVTKQIEKMSKSKCNGVPPESVIEDFSADALRLYITFMGPVEEGGIWDGNGLKGTKRFLDRLWNLFSNKLNFEVTLSGRLERDVHKTIRSITEDIESLKLNTAVSKLMHLLNISAKEERLGSDYFGIFARLLQPFAPHFAEEMWAKLGNEKFVFEEPWPEFSEELCKDQSVEIVVQVNGKRRGSIIVPSDTGEKEIEHLAGDQIVQVAKHHGVFSRIVHVPGRIVNFVL